MAHFLLQGQTYSNKATASSITPYELMGANVYNIPFFKNVGYAFQTHIFLETLHPLNHFLSLTLSFGHPTCVILYMFRENTHDRDRLSPVLTVALINHMPLTIVFNSVPHFPLLFKKGRSQFQPHRGEW